MVVAMTLLLLAHSQLGIRVEETIGLSSADAETMAELLAESSKRIGGMDAVIDSILWTECGREDRCLEETRARTKAAELLILRIFGAGTRAQIIVHRLLPSESVPSRIVQVETPIEKQEWAGMFDGVVRTLFPERADLSLVQKHEPALVVPTPAAEPGREPLYGWLAMGAGGVAGALGVVFRVTSNAAVGEVERDPLGPAELEAAMNRAESHALASNLLFASGAVLVTAGLVYLLVD